MAEQQSEVEQPVVRPFLDILREVRGGDLHDELSSKLAEVVSAVETTGKAGRLTLSMTVKPTKTWGRVSLADDVKTVVPEERSEALFFASGGILSRRDPKQMSFEELRRRPRAVDPETGEIRDEEEAADA